MSALTTRMLVLGVVRIFGPANGYQLRRELLSWEVERWAHLNPGSIYSMLSTLEKQGAIDRHDLAAGEDARAATVYTITESGGEEFLRLVREAIATVPDTGDALPFRVALNFGPVLTRADFLAALERRADVLELGREYISRKAAQLADPPVVPPHVVSELGLEVALASAQLEWLEGFIAEVRGGALDFAGEPHGGWRPPADDPGWRMAAEREDYLRRLGRAPA
jgi:DNA-binding PadR family transcriptional regulator